MNREQMKTGLVSYWFVVQIKSVSLSVLNVSSSWTSKNSLLLETARGGEDGRRKRHDWLVIFVGGGR